MINKFFSPNKTSIRIIVKLRGPPTKIPTVAPKISKSKMSKHSKVKDYHVSYRQTSSPSPFDNQKEDKPLIKSTGLDQDTKYSIFTCTEPSDILLVSPQPLLGKNINATFKNKSNLLELSTSLLTGSTWWEYDQVYSENYRTKALYKADISCHVTNFFHGKNSCILLFGSAKSGKSYITSGSKGQWENELGIIDRAIDDIFRLVDLNNQVNLQSDAQSSLSIYISAYQDYLDTVYDLSLKSPTKIEIEKSYENSAQSCRWVNLTKTKIKNISEYYCFIKEIRRRRKEFGAYFNVQNIKSKSNFVVSIKLEKGELSKINGQGKIKEVKERLKEDYSQIDFVEIMTSDLCLNIDANAGDTSSYKQENNKLFNVGKTTLNAISDNIISINQGLTPKQESKLTLCLKNTLKQGSGIVFINTVIPWEYPPDSSFKSLSFTNWLRNELYKGRRNSERSDINHNLCNDSSGIIMTKVQQKMDYPTEWNKSKNKECIPDSTLINEDVKARTGRIYNIKKLKPELVNNGYSSNEENELKWIRGHRNQTQMKLSSEHKLSTDSKEVKWLSNNKVINTMHSRINNTEGFPSQKNEGYHSNKSVIEGDNVPRYEKDNGTSNTQSQLRYLEESLRQLQQKHDKVTSNLNYLRKDNSKEQVKNENNSPLNISNHKLDTDSPFMSSEITSEFAALKSDNIIFREDVVRLSEINKQIEDELYELQNRNMDLFSENRLILEENNNLQSKLEHLTSQGNDSNSTNIKQWSVYDKLNQKLSFEARIRDNELENKKLWEEKSQFEVDFRVTKERYEEFNEKYEDWNTQLSHARQWHSSEISKIENKIEAMNSEIDMLKKENSVLRSNEEMYKEEIKNMKREKEQLISDNKERENMNAVLNSRIREIERELKVMLQQKENDKKQKDHEDTMMKRKKENKFKVIDDWQTKIAMFRTSRLKAFEVEERAEDY